MSSIIAFVSQTGNVMKTTLTAAVGLLAVAMIATGVAWISILSALQVAAQYVEEVTFLGAHVVPAEYRDDETGQHAKRIGRTSEVLALELGLDAALVERMAALNILYDRDAKGEYFQFYSRAVAKRVFFEVVERRSYDGYGAANAAIRLSAQSLHRDPASI